ncbi:DUF4142 domain-containing protein [Streptomyces griseoviridis]|uniref:DUF4142 domain-containing protein n=1 Tax=Streptomyces griseoviridis TaxID=45398 RepID=A0A918GBD9_STRGD|nr:DUF4142 domain-containing protein [Streptomyces niveoruber]GGS27419.1 hypothetical protein GCM10010238_15200 [Streptomyces niveoruber]
MRMSRSGIGAVVLFGVLRLALTALAFPGVVVLEGEGKDGGQDRLVASTRYGPVTEADRDFVVKVRAAGLWEYPLGELAMERGTSKAMREAGEHLVVGHAGLDAACRRVAAELGIIPPDEASPQQRGSVRTAAGRRGQEFDATAVAVMRVTHGQIFPVIADIRATTRNTEVRELADLANDTVLDHLTVLERTGLVGYGDVGFRQTAPAKLPEDRGTPPPPRPGEPTAVLIPRPDLDVRAGGPTPSLVPAATPTSGG